MNADTMQIFSRNPRGSSYKTYLPEEIERFQKIRKDHAFGPVLAHAPYTMNLASATEKTYEFACTVIREDIRRMDELQIENLVFHPGSHTGDWRRSRNCQYHPWTGSGNYRFGEHYGFTGNDEWKGYRDRLPV